MTSLEKEVISSWKSLENQSDFHTNPGVNMLTVDQIIQLRNSVHRDRVTRGTVLAALSESGTF